MSRLRAGAPQILLSLIVFSMASGVLGGIIFYVDNSTSQVLTEATQDVPIDLAVEIQSSFYSQNNMSIDDAVQVVASQDLVETAAAVFRLEYYDWNQDYGSRYWVNQLLGVNDDFFTKFPNAVDAPSDNGELTNGTCWVESRTMSDLGLEVGDNFSITFTYWGMENYVVKQFDYKIVGTFETNVFARSITWNRPPTSLVRAIIDYNTLRSTFQPGMTDYNFEAHDVIVAHLDRSKILSTDAETLTQELSRLSKRIEQALLPHAVILYYDYPINTALQEYIAWSMSMRLVAVAFSIPTIIMGVILAYYDSNAQADSLRRDVGTLKTRGASSRQAFAWVMSRSLIIAVLGALGAVVTGAVGGMVAGTVKTFLSFDLSRLAGLRFFLVPQSVLFVFVFSFTVGLLVSIPTVYRALTISLAEAHQVIESEILLSREKMGNPAVDLSVLACAAYMLLPFLMAIAYSYYDTGSFASLMAFTAPMLVLFIVFFTRLFSRPASGIKAAILERLKRPAVAPGTRVVGRSVRLHKKTEALAVMFIAMVFAAGVVSSISATTGYNHLHDLKMFIAGGDIVIDVSSSATNITPALAHNISQIDGVVSVSPVLEVMGFVTYRQAYPGGYAETENYSIQILGVDGASLSQTAFWRSDFAWSNDPKGALLSLALDNTSVIASFKPIRAYTGDHMQTPVYYDDITVGLDGPGWKNITLCTITDVFASPRLETTYLPGYPDAGRFLIMNLDYVQACTNTTAVSRFYVKTEPGANYSRIVDEIVALSPSSFTGAKSGPLEIEKALEARAGQTIYGVYTLDMIFSVLFLTAGMAILAAQRGKKLRRSFSILRALGCEPKPMLIATLADTSLSVLLAMLIGGLLGGFLSLMFINVPLVYTGVGVTQEWRRLPVMITIPWTILVAVAAVSFVAALLATYAVGLSNLRKNIAEEIQYAE
ncbi:MAG: hypothetical protein ACTSVD_09590 [Candidatus Thorarchaeota archaeon]